MTASNNVNYFKSKNYPQFYPHYQDCKWEIKATVGFVVELTFKDFLLEKHSNCKYDYLELSEDDVSNNHTVIAKLCSTQGVNKTFYSSGINIRVKFHTDSSNRHKGFLASYKQGGFGYIIIVEKVDKNISMQY